MTVNLSFYKTLMAIIMAMPRAATFYMADGGDGGDDGGGGDAGGDAGGDPGGGAPEEASRREMIEALAQGKEIDEETGAIKDGEVAGSENGGLPGTGEGGDGAGPAGDKGQGAQANANGAATGADAGGAEGEQKLTPPEHWSADDKKLFEGQPKEVQKYILDRSSAMDAAHTQRSQELASHRKALEPLTNAVNEAMPYLNQVGIPPDVAFTELVRAEQVLRMGTPGQKQQAILKLMGDYGISLDGVDPSGTGQQAGDEIAPYLEQYIQPIAGQVNQMQAFLQHQSQAAHQTNVAQLEGQIAAFREAKGEDGQLSHPYFAEVEADMARLAQADIANGVAPTLDKLYEAAVWSNPVVREKLVAAQQKAAADKAEAERKKRVEQAKQTQSASPGVSGVTATAEQPGDRRAFIRKQFEEAAA